MKYCSHSNSLLLLADLTHSTGAYGVSSHLTLSTPLLTPLPLSHKNHSNCAISFSVHSYAHCILLSPPSLLPSLSLSLAPDDLPTRMYLTPLSNSPHLHSLLLPLPAIHGLTNPTSHPHSILSHAPLPTTHLSTILTTTCTPSLTFSRSTRVSSLYIHNIPLKHKLYH